MKNKIKKTTLLLVIFFFIYPIYLRFFPVPLNRIYQILGFACLLVNPTDLNKLTKSNHINRYWGITLLLFLLAFFPQIWVTGGTDFFFIKIIINVFLEFFSVYFVYRISLWALKTVNIGAIIYYIVLAALLQVLVSTVFFIKPEYYEIYYSYLNEDVMRKDYTEMIELLNIRFIGIGSEFFGGVTKYGIAFFSVLILPFVHNNLLTRNKLFYWIAVLVIFIGGLLTGRSFIVAILLGVIMVTLYKSESIAEFLVENIKLILIFITLLIVSYFILSAIIGKEQFQRIYNFAFEMFINFSSGKGFQSQSTSSLSNMYIYPESEKTWFFGDGRMTNFDNSYYKGTDVGYIRLLFYFGLPATVFFIYVLYRYSKILIELTHSNALKYFYITIFWWYFILNFKGLSFHSYYLILFLVFMVLPKESIHVKSSLKYNS